MLAIAYVDLKLWLIKVVKLDMRWWSGFSNLVTYIELCMYMRV